MILNVMTFNTQHCRNFITGFIDYDIMAKAIKDCNADIVGLNEMRGLGRDREDYEEQVKILSEKTGLSYYYFGEAIRFHGVNPYGNGLLSRYPIIGAYTVQIPDPPVEGRNPEGYYETRCVLCADVDAGAPLSVCVSHFGLMPEEKSNAVLTVTEILPQEKCILMGDFNAMPEERVLLPIREKMCDAADAFSEKKLSYPSDKPKKKIDYIFVTKDIKVLGADIPEIVASDHRPHTARIEINTGNV